LALMQDANADIRDWATFGLRVLGSLGSDQIRTGLSERLIDTICDVREEALVGLAKRKDRQALLTLIAELGRPGVSRRSSRRPRNFWARIKPGWFKAPRFARRIEETVLDIAFCPNQLLIRLHSKLTPKRAPFILCRVTGQLPRLDPIHDF
jgi:hypothetical protein